MTSIFNYIATIALAIVVAAGAALVYVLYTHFAQPPTTTATAPSATTAPPTTQPTTPPTTAQPPTTTSPSQRSTVKSVVLYVATPEVITKCAPGLGNGYIYYFNVTVDRIRAEDLVQPYDYQRSDYVFKARAGDMVLNLTGAHSLPSNQEFFKQYNNPSVTEQMGLVNVYLEIETDKSLNITAVRYLGAEYNINRVVYVSCIKQIEIKMANATNERPIIASGPGSLGLIPAGAAYKINVTLPPGKYQLRPPRDVKVEPDVVEGGKLQTLTITLLNKPQVYDPLVINATRVG